MPEQSNDYRVVVFGAGGVGKSSLVLRFVKGTFRESYIPTIEDTYRQVISCDKSICTLQITDTTGSHQFPAMQRLSISKGHAFILVYSITSKQSLEELKPIYEQVCQIKGDVESIPIMLVGNKCDDSLREVQASDGESQAKRWKCGFMETSAKTNHNVKELFQELLNLEKRRAVSLQIDGKKSKQQKRTEKLKGKVESAWNVLPEEVEEADTIATLKNHLDKYVNRKGIEGYGSLEEAKEPNGLNIDFTSFKISSPNLPIFWLTLYWSFFEKVTCAVDKDELVDVRYLDSQKTFDKLGWNIGDSGVSAHRWEKRDFKEHPFAEVLVIGSLGLEQACIWKLHSQKRVEDRILFLEHLQVWSQCYPCTPLRPAPSLAVAVVPEPLRSQQ
eukprot:g48396.t1